MKYADYDKAFIRRHERGRLPGAHGPGLRVNACLGWNWRGMEIDTGRVRTYFTRTSITKKNDFKEMVERRFWRIRFIDCGEAREEPMVVTPLPPCSFQNTTAFDDIISKFKPTVMAFAPLASLSKLPSSTVPKVPIASIPKIIVPTKRK